MKNSLSLRRQSFRAESDFNFYNSTRYEVVENGKNFVVIMDRWCQPSEFTLYVGGKFKASGSLEFVKRFVS